MELRLYSCRLVLTEGIYIYIKVAGIGVGTLPGLQGVGHGLRCKAEGEGQETRREVVAYLSWAAPPYVYACGCVLAYAEKWLTIFNTYTHPTDQPIAKNND